MWCSPSVVSALHSSYLLCFSALTHNCVVLYSSRLFCPSVLTQWSVFATSSQCCHFCVCLKIVMFIYIYICPPVHSRNLSHRPKQTIGSMTDCAPCSTCPFDVPRCVRSRRTPTTNARRHSPAVNTQATDAPNSCQRSILTSKQIFYPFVNGLAFRRPIIRQHHSTSWILFFPPLLCLALSTIAVWSSCC